MNDMESVIQAIREAFGGNQYPGDAFLLGSREGCEPVEEVGPFMGQRDWQAVDAGFLDAHATALSFFSEAGFRFFLPAYLIADLEERLQTADPLFHLTNGFSDGAVQIPTASGVFVRKLGRSAFVNPRRYGAMTFHDYARYRLSVFTREEAQAIVAYLETKRDADPHGLNREQIDGALNSFWRERASSAPAASSLEEHLATEERYLAAVHRDGG